MQRLIMVPLDGSRFAETAIPAALSVGGAWNAEVEAVTVHEPLPSLDHHLWDAAARKWSESYLEDIVRRVGDTAGTTITSATLNGPVAEALQRHAEDRGVDLVVMASHGRGPLSRVWLGSVADAFVRHATMPVLVVRPDEAPEPDLAATVCFNHVLVPLDGTDESRAILEATQDLVEACPCRYTLVRVFPYGDEIAATYMPHTVQLNTNLVSEGREKARANVEARAAELRARGVEAEARLVVDRSPAGGILRLAEELDVDLIAMATHGRSGVARVLLGSVTDKVLRGAHTPILVQRPQSD